MINNSKTKLTLVALAITGLAFNVAAEDKPVQVFILAGQSNMEGHGLIELDGRRADGYNVESYFLIGDAMGKAMIQLSK